jgi:uncharacterized protein
MKKRQAVCGAAFFLANVAAGPAQTDPGLSIKPAGMTLSGERLAPEKAPVDLSRPEMRQIERLSTRLESEYADAATRGEAWAQTKLGKIYVMTTSDELRQQRGVELLREAAEQDDAEAIYFLATLSAMGIGVKESKIDAFENMKRAAELGMAEAQFELALMHSEGRGTARNIDAAELWLRKAAGQNHEEAKFTLGRTLLVSAEADRKAEGEAYLEELSRSGHAPSAIFLADAVGNGKFGLMKDELKAESLLKPLAQQGNADCQFLLAALYRFGDAFVDKRDEALTLIEEAANQGHPDALLIQKGRKP